MLFETALLGCFVYIVGTGKSVRAAARMVGFGVGRAAGSLRRARAAVEGAQRRVERVGGEELTADRLAVAERMRKLRAIQAEALALLSTPPRGGAAGEAPPTFSDEEVAAARLAGGAEEPRADGGEHAAAAAAQPPQPPRQAAPPPPPQEPPPPRGAVAYYYEGRPVVQASFESVWEAGSSVPLGLTQQHVAEAIRTGRDLDAIVLEKQGGAAAPKKLQ
jgi:hypothetical protein